MPERRPLMTATLYINTTVINGSKDVPPIENGAVLVDEAGIIAAIAPLKEIDVPSGTNTVNLGGAWIMPGLINAHAHFFSSGRLVRSLSGNTLRLVLFLSSTRIGKVYLKRIYSRETLVALNAGITTIRDVGSMHNLDLHFRDLFSTGRRIGPRILACGGMITTNGGHGADFPGSTVVSSPRECREAVRERWSNGVDWIKICSTGGVIDARFIGEAGKPYMTPEQIEAVCDEAHRLGLMVASHCESTAGMRDALSGGVDTIEHGGIIEADMIPSFLDNPKSLRGYTSVIPTLAAHSPSERRKLKDTERNRIIKANADMVRKGSEDALKKSLLHGIKAGIGDDATLPGVTPLQPVQRTHQLPGSRRTHSVGGH